MPFSDLVECIENYKLLTVNTMCSVKKGSNIFMVEIWVKRVI